MDVQVHRPKAKSFDSIVNELRPEIIFRCVDCQTFLLPDELSVVHAKWRQAGEARTMSYPVCPVCHPVLEYNNEMVPFSQFVTLTREEYEHTVSAERWGMVYNLETKQAENPHKQIVVPN